MKNYTKTKVTVLFAWLLFAYSCTETDLGSPTGDDRDSFTGSWNCNENSVLYNTSSYVVSISKTGNADTVIIKNFYQLGTGTSTLALVSGGSITIPNQDVGSIKVWGTGILSNNKINLSYYSLDGTLKDTEIGRAHV